MNAMNERDNDEDSITERVRRRRRRQRRPSRRARDDRARASRRDALIHSMHSFGRLQKKTFARRIDEWSMTYGIRETKRNEKGMRLTRVLFHRAARRRGRLYPSSSTYSRRPNETKRNEEGMRIVRVCISSRRASTMSTVPVVVFRLFPLSLTGRRIVIVRVPLGTLVRLP